MTNSRRHILDKLQRDDAPFPEVSKPTIYRPMVAIADETPAALQALFVDKAVAASCVVHQTTSTANAVGSILDILGEDTAASCWEFSKIPLPGLEEALEKARIRCVGEDASVRVGITGADAALAATGSLVVSSGEGRYRASSLLPPIHIAVLSRDRILPDLESWWALQRTAGLDQMRQASNVVIITGPSRTADIALQLVMGMHGPRELHVVLVGQS